MMVDAKKTGALIAELRHERELTQAQLGQRLGVADRTVSRWETGGGLPDVSMLADLATELGVTVDELLTGERAPRPDGELQGTMTGLRTGPALAALARSGTSLVLRCLQALGAVVCVWFAPWALRFVPDKAGWAVAALLLAAAAFLGVDAVFCVCRAAALRRACRDDRDPVRIQVDETGCRWNRDGVEYRFPHRALRRIDRWKQGFVLVWKGGLAFVGTEDEPWVALASAKSGAAYRNCRLSAGPALVAVLLVSAFLGTKTADWQYTRHLYQSWENTSSVQMVPGAQAPAAAPDFSGTEQRQYTVTEEGVWFSVDGAVTMISPQTSGALVRDPTDLVVGLAGDAALGALCPEGGGSYFVTVSTDDGAHWNRTHLGQLCRSAVWGTLFFPTESFGYAALGTDFSMGTGKESRAWFTLDGGVSWQEYPNVPQGEAQNLLCGFCALEDQSAVLSLTTSNEENWPLVYCTQDAGATWTQVQLPFEDAGIDYLHAVCSLTKDGSDYVLTLTQQPYADQTATFRAQQLSGPWTAQAS
ncbi:helix-turn-helix domain-containing protein [uncultured Ruthenibacterium sp.]|uniref:helix-turn-helix domain-containing protein n=1 Tax=uncultured Ruthenibacterium sp. TaxID=1905347 RepID=UPI00349EF3CF